MDYVRLRSKSCVGTYLRRLIEFSVVSRSTAVVIPSWPWDVGVGSFYVLFRSFDVGGQTVISSGDIHKGRKA